MAARLLDMHPQTLRKYERLGLVRPTRTVGSMRVYSSDELERLRLIKHLVDEAGINLAGVQRLLSIAEAVQRLRPLIARTAAPTAAPARAGNRAIGEMVGLDMAVSDGEIAKAAMGIRENGDCRWWQ